MMNQSPVIYLIALLTLVHVSFGQAPNLGTASSFALFTANGAFTNSGASMVTGDIGTNVGAFSGFPPGAVTGQIRLPGSTEANQAATDVVAAYNSLSPLACATTILPELGGQTLTPGVSCQPTAAATSLNGTLTLSGAGVYIIKLNSALTTGTNSTILLTNGATADNVFFQVNGAASLGTGSTFRGTILATGAIFLSTQAFLEGRGLSTAGAITLNNNVVTNSALSISATAGACTPATNQYAVSGTVSFTNSTAATATLTDGTTTITIAVSAGNTAIPYSLTGLLSGTGSHTVTVSYAGKVASVSYAAPASCTTASASLGGVVYADNNANAVQDGGDTPIGGALVTLLDGSNTPVSSATTGSSGLYSFSGLTPGSPYSVSFTTPAGYTTTAAAVTGPVTLTAGEARTIPSFGFQPATTPAASALAVSVTSGSCQTATNQYTLTGLLSLTAAQAGSVTLTDGANSTVVSVSAGQTNASFTLPGLASGTSSHTVIASGSGYVPFRVVYTAPGSCQVTPGSPLLSLESFVSLSKAKTGDLLTYNVVLTNAGSASTSAIVRDSVSSGGTYVNGSATVPAGTSASVNQSVIVWSVPSIAAGQSLTLTFQARVDATGILYAIATIPGDTAKVCTSIPVKLCVGDEYTLTVPTGRAVYRWYKDGVLIQGQTTNSLVVSQSGTYSLGTDNASGSCPDYSCCPFIAEEDTLPAYQASTIRTTCVNNSPQNNGQLRLTNANPVHTYQFSLGATFNPMASLSGPPQAIPANGVLTTSLPNSAASQSYTVRVYNSSGCYVDQTVLLLPTVCGCPVEVCVPFVLAQTKRPKRIGDPVR